MKQKFSVSVPIVGEKLRSSGRPLPDDDSEEETKVDEIEYDDPVNFLQKKKGAWAAIAKFLVCSNGRTKFWNPHERPRI